MCEFCDMLKHKVFELEKENLDMKRELSILRMENKIKDEQMTTLKRDILDYKFSTRYVFQGEPMQKVVDYKNMPF
jgi:hypothetical protein